MSVLKKTSLINIISIIIYQREEIHNQYKKIVKLLYLI